MSAVTYEHAAQYLDQIGAVIRSVPLHERDGEQHVMVSVTLPDTITVFAGTFEDCIVQAYDRAVYGPEAVIR
jgi:hypothetical protein